MCVQSFGQYYCAPPCSDAAPECPPNYVCGVESGACFKSEECGPGHQCAADLVCAVEATTYCTPFCDDGGGCPYYYRCDPAKNVCFKSQSEGCGPYNQCDGNGVCADDGGMYCTQYCDANGACPAGFVCDPGTNVCFADRSEPAAIDDDTTTSTASCSMAGGSGAGAVAWWLLPGVALGLGWLRRRW